MAWHWLGLAESDWCVVAPVLPIHHLLVFECIRIIGAGKVGAQVWVNPDIGHTVSKSLV